MMETEEITITCNILFSGAILYLVFLGICSCLGKKPSPKDSPKDVEKENPPAEDPVGSDPVVQQKCTPAHPKYEDVELPADFTRPTAKSYIKMMNENKDGVFYPMCVYLDHEIQKTQGDFQKLHFCGDIATIAPIISRIEEKHYVELADRLREYLAEGGFICKTCDLSPSGKFEIKITELSP